MTSLITKLEHKLKSKKLKDKINRDKQDERLWVLTENDFVFIL
jgi:hypothetical protein